MTCPICNHPQRQDIDRALLDGKVPLADLSNQFGLSLPALSRHKQHLQAKVRRAQERLPDTLRQGCLVTLSMFLGMAMQTAQAASAEGNSGLVLRAITAGIRLVTQITKMDVQFDPDTVYRFLASPELISQDSLLPSDPRIISCARQSLVDDLFSPCPEQDYLPGSPEATAKSEAEPGAPDLKRPDLKREDTSKKSPPAEPSRPRSLAAPPPATDNRKLAGPGSQPPAPGKTPLDEFLEKWGDIANLPENQAITANIVKNYNEIMRLEKEARERLRQESVPDQLATPIPEILVPR